VAQLALSTCPELDLLHGAVSCADFRVGKDFPGIAGIDQHLRE
jgi:hypothetical protein